MSGGSMNYLFMRVDDVADCLVRSTDPLRVMFGKHLHAVADALHDIEWVDSADLAQGDEHAAIRNVLGLELSVVSVVADKLREMADAIDSLAATPQDGDR